MSHIGIDLGTTTTLLANVRVAPHSSVISAEIIPVGNEAANDKSLKSVAYIQGDTACVGGDATKLKAENPEFFVRAAKRLIGREVLLPSVHWTPRQVSALYLKHVIDVAVQKVGFTPQDQLTITVPASFTATQRTDTLEALKIGARNYTNLISQERLQNVLISEPTAALLSIVNDDFSKPEANRTFQINTSPTVLVYDIGGGTLDITIVRLSWKDPSKPAEILNVQFETLELTRYNQFGGEDFDLAVAKRLLERYLIDYPELANQYITSIDLEKFHLLLLEDAETLKKQLNDELIWSQNPSLDFTSSPLLINEKQYRILNWNIRLDEYLHWVSDLMDASLTSKNLISPIDSVLERANLTKQQIQHFVAIGGMVDFRPVAERLRQYWGNDAQFLVPVNPDIEVARGAAVYSYLKSKQPGYIIHEPIADVFYIKTKEGFAVLYDQRIVQQPSFHATTTQDSQFLELHVFTGDPVRAGEPLRTIYPTLIPQGSLTIDMGSTQPANTDVYIDLVFLENDSSKVPAVRVAISNQTNVVSMKQLTLI